ncbi:hypothetical protein ABBQ38_008115 [Trebouxia sp. C0009 RCD-2024]
MAGAAQQAQRAQQAQHGALLTLLLPKTDDQYHQRRQWQPATVLEMVLHRIWAKLQNETWLPATEPTPSQSSQGGPDLQAATLQQHQSGAEIPVGRENGLSRPSCNSMANNASEVATSGAVGKTPAGSPALHTSELAKEAELHLRRQKFTLVPVLQEVIVKMCYADGCSFAHEAVNADMLLVTQQLLAAWASWKGAIRRRARQSTALLAGPDLHGYQQGEACIGGLDKLPVQSCGKAAVDSKRPVLWSSSSALLQAVQGRLGGSSPKASKTKHSAFGPTGSQHEEACCGGLQKLLAQLCDEAAVAPWSSGAASPHGLCWVGWEEAVQRRVRQSTARLDLHGYQHEEAFSGGREKLPAQPCGKATVNSTPQRFGHLLQLPCSA